MNKKLGTTILASIGILAAGLGVAIISTGSSGVLPATAEETTVELEDLPVLGRLPSFDGAVGWLNSTPLTPEALKGKVVLVNFWTYACGDCISTMPTINQWADTYGPQGLVVIGVHSPEFAFEKSRANLERAASNYGINYPVAIDNDYAIWKGFNNNYWPEQYVIDAQGDIRYHHLGQGNYAQTQSVIEALLRAQNPGGSTGSNNLSDTDGGHATAAVAP